MNNKTKIALLLIFFFVFIVIAVFIATGLKPSLKKAPTQSPTIQTSAPIITPQVLSVIPDKTVLLKPGRIQVFYIEFEKQLKPSFVQAKLYQKVFYTNSPPAIIKTSQHLENGGKTLMIVPDSTISALSRYNLYLINTLNNSVIFKISYLSDNPQSTPVPVNNKALIPFLPWETASYKLSYYAPGNIYVFNFKYNPNSPDSPETQYEKAKADAIDFIKSKGVDPSTLVVAWKHS